MMKKSSKYKYAKYFEKMKGSGFTEEQRKRAQNLVNISKMNQDLFKDLNKLPITNPSPYEKYIDDILEDIETESVDIKDNMNNYYYARSDSYLIEILYPNRVKTAKRLVLLSEENPTEKFIDYCRRIFEKKNYLVAVLNFCNSNLNNRRYEVTLGELRSINCKIIVKLCEKLTIDELSTESILANKFHNFLKLSKIKLVASYESSEYNCHNVNVKNLSDIELELLESKLSDLLTVKNGYETKVKYFIPTRGFTVVYCVDFFQIMCDLLDIDKTTALNIVSDGFSVHEKKSDLIYIAYGDIYSGLYEYEDLSENGKLIFDRYNDIIQNKNKN
jgi:hypothetical protein